MRNLDPPVVEVKHTHTCMECEKQFTPRLFANSKRARYCSDACKRRFGKRPLSERDQRLMQYGYKEPE